MAGCTSFPQRSLPLHLSILSDLQSPPPLAKSLLHSLQRVSSMSALALLAFAAHSVKENTKTLKMQKHSHLSRLAFDTKGSAKN